MADKPFPNAEAELNLLLQNMASKIGAYSATLALTVLEVAHLNEDAGNFNYVLNAATQVTDSKDAFFSFKAELFDGEPSDAVMPMPVFPIITTPDDAKPGIKKRTRNLIQRIKTSPGYTEQIGEDLGLVDSGAPNGPQSLENLTAALTLKALASNKVEIAFSKQGMDAMRVEFKRKDDTAFSLAGIYTSSPGMHDAPSVPPGDPESRQYRGTLLHKNEPVGNFSPIYTVVTTP